MHGERDSRGGGVAKAININDHGLGAESQPVSRSLNDALVRLMGNEGVNITALEVVTFEKGVGNFQLLLHCILEYSLTVLVDEVHFFVHGLVGGRMEAAAAGHVKGTRARAVNFVKEIDEADGIVFGG